MKLIPLSFSLGVVATWSNCTMSQWNVFVVSAAPRPATSPAAAPSSAGITTRSPPKSLLLHILGGTHGETYFLLCDCRGLKIRGKFSRRWRQQPHISISLVEELGRRCVRDASASSLPNVTARHQPDNPSDHACLTWTYQDCCRAGSMSHSLLIYSLQGLRGLDEDISLFIFTKNKRTL